MQKQQMPMDNPQGDSRTIEPKLDESDVNKDKAKWRTLRVANIWKGTSVEISNGSRVELLTLHDENVIAFCAMYTIPCTHCLLCLGFFNKPLSPHLKGKMKYGCYMYVDSWLCSGMWRGSSKSIQ